MRRVSFLLDISLVFRTARKVLVREGIQQCNEAFQNKLGKTLLQNDLSLPSTTEATRSF